MDVTNSAASGVATSKFANKDAYTVGWICALHVEMAAAKSMLDEIHHFQIAQDKEDHNSYTLGRMQGHSVVIACLPDAEYGTTSAATVAKDMLRSFKSIRFGLMVGIGGGAPSSTHDIRLGDVVVSQPTDTNGGVIQYDMGKTLENGEFERKGWLNAPPTMLRTAVSRLRGDHLIDDSLIPKFLSEAMKNRAKMRKRFSYQGAANDCLFLAGYKHIEGNSDCSNCDHTQTEDREDRDDAVPVVHYGTIASGNQVMKSSTTRDQLSQKLGILCFEMEAAGLMQEFPCLVIRGICDYSDSHKNEAWQGYAAATAAAYAKELLSVISAAQVQMEDIVLLENLIRDQIQEQRIRHEDKCLKTLSKADPYDHKGRILDTKGELLQESYRWIMGSPEFKQWRSQPKTHWLWIKGDPGKGKTMLLCGLIQELEKETNCSVHYFFCQATEDELKTANAVLRGLIYHLVQKHRRLISHVRKEYDTKRKDVFEDTNPNAWQVLSRVMESMLQDNCLREVLIIVDALDECEEMDNRHRLLEFFRMISARYGVKLIISSRNWRDIEKGMGDETTGTSILSLEHEDNRSFISAAVAAYINREVDVLARNEPYKSDMNIVNKVREHLMANAENTFLWVALVCNELAKRNIDEEEHVVDVLKNSPPGLKGLYERMLSSISGSRYPELSEDILATTSVLKRSATLHELQCILNASPNFNGKLNTLRNAIRACGSFLNLSSNMVEFVHQTAVEFLHDNAPTLRNTKERHRDVFWNSLVELFESKYITRDVYGIEAPATAYHAIQLPEPDPMSALQYCNVYWVDHLADWVRAGSSNSRTTTPTESDAILKVQSFLEKKLVYWIEGLALHGQVQQAVKAIQKLQTLIDGMSNAVAQDLAKLVHDASRWLRYHKEVIETYPFQVYVSALCFSPDESIVRETFSHEAPKWATVRLGPETNWNACLQTLSDHRDQVRSLTYSKNGQWFLSGSDDGTAKLWDTETGTCAQTLGGHGIEPHRVFPNKSQIASVQITEFYTNDMLNQGATRCRNGKMKVWNLANGDCIRNTQHNLSGAKCLAISPDHQRVAYGLSNNTVAIWYAEEKQPFLSLQGHGSHAHSITFSPNSEMVVGQAAESYMM